MNLFKKKTQSPIDAETLKVLRQRVCWLESARIQGIITADEFDREMALIDFELSEMESSR